MNDLLEKLWEVYGENTFSDNWITRDLGLKRHDQHRVMQALNQLTERPPVNEIAVKAVGGGVYRLTKTTGDGNDKKGITPLSTPKQTRTGEKRADSEGFSEHLPDKSEFLPKVPTELKERRQWILWINETRDGKPTKVPYQVNGRKAQANNPDTWFAFSQAEAAYTRKSSSFSGLGFVLSPDDPYCGIDLDNCIDESGNIKVWAQAMVNKLHEVGYGEISPSGNGIKFWTRAKLPIGSKKKRWLDEDAGEAIEVYDHGRYFTVTGKGKGTIADGQAVMDWICHVYLQKQTKPEPNRKTKPLSPGFNLDEVIEKIRQSKQAAKFNALMDGNTAGYGSPSEADQALCCVIAFWTQETDQIDAIYRSSQLLRNKWDEKHSTDGRTYGQMTIDKAINEYLSETYQEPKQRGIFSSPQPQHRHKRRGIF